MKILHGTSFRCRLGINEAAMWIRGRSGVSDSFENNLTAHLKSSSGEMIAEDLKTVSPLASSISVLNGQVEV